ncbi:FHA domain-containing protein, partial [Singulisphaera rosea]
MKVQLIVVQGKPEGKVIPLVLPVFKIGRGETCHLRPSSELVSREHAEFTVSATEVKVRDLGSRNGTLVNGKTLSQPCVLKDRDLVQVGSLTFAVSIQVSPASGVKSSASSSPKAAVKVASPDDVSNDDIDSWLVADSTHSVPERPSGVYNGDTITIDSFKEKEAPKPKAKPATPAAAAPAPAPPAPVPA